MQRIAHVGIALCAVALLSGCEDKNKGLEAEPAQSTSVAYQQPSYGYYAPDAQANLPGGEVYDYSTVDDSAVAATAAGSTHVVVKGDTLYALARTYYRDQARWRDIYDANRGVLHSADLLPLGQELTIP